MAPASVILPVVAAMVSLPFSVRLLLMTCELVPALVMPPLRPMALPMMVKALPLLWNVMPLKMVPAA